MRSGDAMDDRVLDDAELVPLTAVIDDAARWDALALRVARHAVGKGGAVRLLSANVAAWTLAASLVLAATLMLNLIARPGTPSPRVEWVTMLAPPDVTARTLAAAQTPPSIGALLLAGGVEVR